jgi:hypothetical protein
MPVFPLYASPLTSGCDLTTKVAKLLDPVLKTIDHRQASVLEWKISAAWKETEGEQEGWDTMTGILWHLERDSARHCIILLECVGRPGISIDLELSTVSNPKKCHI